MVDEYDQWNFLREQLKSLSKNKDYPSIIETCKAILQFSEQHPQMSIVDWMFLKKIAVALERQKEISQAVQYYGRAIQECERWRRSARLTTNDDFIDDTNLMKRKLERLSKKA